MYQTQDVSIIWTFRYICQYLGSNYRTVTYPFSLDECSDIEGMISDFMFLGGFFILDGLLMDRCIRRHGSWCVPDDKIR